MPKKGLWHFIIYLLQMCIRDRRFTAYYDKQVPGCARFLRDAVAYWVK